jgi:hypothetical protein
VRRIAFAAALLALAAPAARAGGDFTDVAAAPAAVWAVGDFGVDKIDGRTGRVLRQIVVGPAHPLSVVVAGGAAWVASVANGFGSGAVTRIDAKTGRARVVLRRNWSAQQVAVSPGSVWVLLGSRRTNRVARFDLDGRLRSLTPVGVGGGWLTADEQGAWVCCRDRTMLRLDPNGRLRSTFSLPAQNPIWAAAESIWSPGTGASVLTRFDVRTGHTLARIPLVDTQDVAAAGASVYALGSRALIRIEAATNRVLARRAIPGIPHAVSATAGAVWVTWVSHGGTAHLLRLDPRTLRIEVRLALY